MWGVISLPNPTAEPTVNMLKYKRDTQLTQLEPISWPSLLSAIYWIKAQITTPNIFCQYLAPVKLKARIQQQITITYMALA